jgi:hypothetical protein
VANFEGCNIHDNTADYVCLHLELPELSSIALGLTLELTGCCDFGVAVCEYSHFEPSATFPPWPLWMELDLVLAAHRAVASMLAEWQTSKAAISMTTPQST